MILAVCKNLLKCERRFLCERHARLGATLARLLTCCLIARRRHE